MYCPTSHTFQSKSLSLSLSQFTSVGRELVEQSESRRVEMKVVKQNGHERLIPSPAPINIDDYVKGSDVWCKHW